MISPSPTVGAPGASPADYAACRHVLRRASRNYAFATRFLPTAKQHHVAALYAFVRVGDDLVDVAHHGFASPLAAIADWETAYWRAFETGTSDRPVMRAYLATALEFGIPPDTMSPYFRAMRADLSINRFPTYEDLLHYMGGSAIPVGRAMTHILGVRPPHTLASTLPCADSLAVAMQLSNFWRDIGHDWRIGRLYIPGEDLARFGVGEDDIAAGHISRAFVRLLEFEFERTEAHYVAARQGVARLKDGRWGTMAGLEIYRAIIASIRRNGYDVFERRAGATALEKLRLALKARWIVSRPVEDRNAPCVR